MKKANQVTTIQFGDHIVERMPPHSIEAEEAVLGSMLIDRGAFEQAARVLGPADFFIVRNGWIFSAMTAIYERGDPVDFVTLVRELQACGKIDELGGPAEISRLLSSVPTAIHAEGYARVVKRLSLRRGMLGLASKLAIAAYDETVDEFAGLQESLDAATALKFAVLSRLNNEEKFMTSDHILRTEWSEPRWTVPGLMSVGLGFLGGKQKSGKSWMMMQIACAKAAGGRVFNLKVDPGPVLYLALEDSGRRLKNRMIKQQWPGGLPVDFVMMEGFESEFGDLSMGGADRIIYLLENRGYHLVVVDTFSKAIGMYLKSGDVNDSSVITRSLARLQAAALANNATICFVDHHGKAANNDPVNDVIGSIAKGGVSDFMWGLYRERGKTGAVLQIVGRDVDGDQTMLLSWDAEFGIWNHEGDGSTIRVTQRREDILSFLKVNGKAMVQTIADGVRQPKSHTHERLSALVSDGLVKREEIGNNVWYLIGDE
jgi:hypothetical protein